MAQREQRVHQPEIDYDLVIAGSGIAGLTLACHLVHQGLRIAILDKGCPSMECQESVSQGESELRVSAITQGSRQILEKIGAWQRLINQPAPFQQVHVWESATKTNLFLDAAEYGQSSLGYIVKNQDLRQALSCQVRTDNHAHWLFSKLIDMTWNENRALLQLASGEKIATQLLVGADGIASTVRRLAGIPVVIKDYQQCALVTTVRTEFMHAQMARQVFSSTGSLAFLPLLDPYLSSIVWSTTSEEAKQLLTLPDNLFCLALGDAFNHRLGDIAATSERLSFSLNTQQCEQIVKPNLALIGDAAHTVHPLAGQGANLGIADAQCLAKVVLENQKKQHFLGTWHYLRRYERERRFYHLIMGLAIDSIQHLFVTDNPFLKGVGKLGLNLTNRVSLLKHYLVSYAMGKPSFNLLK